MLVAGSTNIGELNSRYELTVPEEDYTTIGGYVFGALGRLPALGDRVSAGGATFVVRGDGWPPRGVAGHGVGHRG